MRIARWCGMALLAVALPSSRAWAVASDASTSNQIGTNNGLTLTVDTPDTSNGDNAPDGRLFCTRYSDGECVPLNKSVCDGNDLRTVTLELSATAGVIPANSRLFIFATRSTCTFGVGAEPDDSSVEDIDLSASSPLVLGTTYDFPDDDGGTMYASAADIAEAIGLCSTTIDNRRYHLCFSVSTATTDDGADAAVDSEEPRAYLTFLVDNVPPDAPSTFSVEGGDGRVFVTAGLASGNDEVVAYHARYRPHVDDAVTDCSAWADATDFDYARSSTPDSSQDFTLDGFSNGTIYQVCAAALDNAGNLGPYSAIVEVQPLSSCGFIGCYPGDVPTGYCGNVPPSTLALLLSVAGLARKRLRRIAARARGLAWLAGSALVVLPCTARADDWSYMSEPESPDDAPARFGFELRFGPYRPSLSTDAQRDVYDAVYTDKTLFKHKPIMMQLEFDWYVFNENGLAGIYGRAGYWKAHGHTRVCATDDDPSIECTADTIAGSTTGVEKDALYVIPLELGIVYRANQLKRTYGIPLVPYAKAGLVYDVWWSRTAGDTATAADGSKGHGGSPGVSAAVGLAVSFGWLGTTRQSAADLDRASLFIELDYTDAGLRKNALDLSATTAVLGLSVEFP